MSGPIQPTGGGGGPRWPNHNVTAAGGAGGDDESKKLEITRAKNDDRETVDINPEREIERLETLSSLYGPQNEQHFLQTPEHVFTTLLALPDLSNERRVRVTTAYERWKTLRQMRGTMYPLAIEPVSPVEPVGDREAAPDFHREDPSQSDDADGEE